MLPIEKEAALLYSLFLGSDLASGRSVYTGKVSKTGKKEAKCWTEKNPATVETWVDHRSGRTGVGIIPINSENQVTWGAIDADIYGVDHTDIIVEIFQKGLPLVPCLSKSGGLHLYLFCKDWVPAEQMMAKLDALAAILGFGTCEIFPKQTSIIRSEEGREDFGNWINMPYYGQETRYAIGPDRLPIKNVETFVAFAESKRLPVDEFKSFEPAKATNTLLPDGPPCLNILWGRKDHEGHRNELMANTCVYLKKAFPETWENQLEEFNRKLSDPLPSRELENLKKSYKKTEYRYQCQSCILKPFCNATECKQRKFGISDSGGAFLVNNRSLTKIKTEPPVWFLDIQMPNGTYTRMSLSTAELQSPSAFQFRCLEAINVMPPLVKADEWRAHVTQLLEHVAEVEVPPEATPRGRFLDLLSEFLEHKEETNIDCLKRGAVFLEADMLYFRFPDLQQWLLQKRFTELVKGRIIDILQSIGGNPGRKTVGGVCMRFWTLPASWETVDEAELTLPQTTTDIF